MSKIGHTCIIQGIVYAYKKFAQAVSAVVTFSEKAGKSTRLIASEGMLYPKKPMHCGIELLDKIDRR